MEEKNNAKCSFCWVFCFVFLSFSEIITLRKKKKNHKPKTGRNMYRMKMLLQLIVEQNWAHKKKIGFIVCFGRNYGHILNHLSFYSETFFFPLTSCFRASRRGSQLKKKRRRRRTRSCVHGSVGRSRKKKLKGADVSGKDSLQQRPGRVHGSRCSPSSWRVFRGGAGRSLSPGAAIACLREHFPGVGERVRMFLREVFTGGEERKWCGPAETL